MISYFCLQNTTRSRYHVPFPTVFSMSRHDSFRDLGILLSCPALTCSQVGVVFNKKVRAARAYASVAMVKVG